MLATSSASLRATEEADLEFVLELERHPDNVPFIGQWSRGEHEHAFSDLGAPHVWPRRAAGNDPEPDVLLMALHRERGTRHWR